MTRALLIVDVQNDFCEGGSLAVNGGNQVAKGIRTYLENHGGEYDIVVAARDWHDSNSDNGGHISPSPDYVDSWPPHCIAGTPGAAFHPELWPEGERYPHEQVLKGQGVPAYSGFEGANEAGESMEEILRRSNITDVDIAGLAFDYCVKATSLDAAAAGFRANVLRDLTAAIHHDDSAESAMDAAGVTIQDSSGTGPL